MRELLKQLWADEAGYVVSAELVLIGTIVVLSLVAGLAEVSSAITYELQDVAQSFAAWNQSEDSGDWDDHDGIHLADPEHEQESGGDLGGDE